MELTRHQILNVFMPALDVLDKPEDEWDPEDVQVLLDMVATHMELNPSC